MMDTVLERQRFTARGCACNYLNKLAFESESEPENFWEKYKS